MTRSSTHRIRKNTRVSKLTPPRVSKTSTKKTNTNKTKAVKTVGKREFKERILSLKDLPKVNLDETRANALYCNYLYSLVRDRNKNIPDKSQLTLTKIRSKFVDIRDQARSGLCWAFAKTSYYEIEFNKRYLVDIPAPPKKTKKNTKNTKTPEKKEDNTSKPSNEALLSPEKEVVGLKSNFQFSNKYIFFFHLYEQANKYLNSLRKCRMEDQDIHSSDMGEFMYDCFHEGGGCDDYDYITIKYGMVMERDYPSNLHTRSPYELTEIFTSIIRNTINEFFTKPISKLDDLHKNTLDNIYHVLVMFLGEPPKRISVKKGNIDVKNVTPVEFWEKYNPAPMKDVILVHHVPYHSEGLYHHEGEFRAFQETKFVRNRFNLRYRNVKEYIKRSIDDQRAVLFSTDVSRDCSTVIGYADASLFMCYDYLDVPHPINRRTILKSFNLMGWHAMLIVGYYTDNSREDKPIVMWRVISSWGTKVAQGGYFDVTDEWLELSSYNFDLHYGDLSEFHKNMYDNGKVKKLPKYDYSMV